MKRDLDSISFQEVAKMTDDDARTTLEGLRWPDGPVCPRCGGKDVVAVTGGRSGLYRCAACRKDKAQRSDQFTVTVGTIFEDSHIPLSKWMQAFSLLCASKKGISALQLQRQLQLGSYRSAWHMAHRIRHALSLGGPMLSGTVEADETYVGGKPRYRGPHNNRRMGAGSTKAGVIAMVERGGRLRTVIPKKKLSHKDIKMAVLVNVHPSSRLMTDEHHAYKSIGKWFQGGHKTVKHSIREYVRGDAHINTAESFFALFKRGVHGTFHHVERQHLARYCDEFEFRWDHRHITDAERTASALRQVPGKRLMYRDLIK